MKAARIVYPSRCCVCGELQTAPCTVCKSCESLRLHTGAGEGARCPVCGLRGKRCVCDENEHFSTVTFPFFYEGRVQNAIRIMKFREGTHLFAPFAKEMADALERRGMENCADVICFLPMRPRDKRKRGYNQAEELANCLGALLKKPVLPLLRKKEKTARQHDLSRLLRRGNLLGAFDPDPKYLDRIENRRVLLVDDIHTSGNTLNEAAKTLMIFGAARVDCLCAAATPSRNST